MTQSWRIPSVQVGIEPRIFRFWHGGLSHQANEMVGRKDDGGGGGGGGVVVVVESKSDWDKKI